MTATPPLQKEWKRLFEAALRIRQMSPWEWMIETDVWGVQNPERDEIGFVSVMGSLGEHLGISVYLGTGALAGMLELHRLPPRTLSEYPELLIEIPQLQVSFEDRNVLDEWDRQLIRSLGVKVRGSQAWPLFQSFRPGYMPWRLEADEIRVLATALEQLEAVAPRVRDDASLLKYNKAGRCLIRTRIADETWEDRVVAIPPPERPPIPLCWDPEDVKHLKQVPDSGEIVELDFFLFPGAIGKKTERPETAYVLLALLHHSNTIVCAEILQVRDTLENMWGQIPEILLAQLANLGIRPAEIRVQSPLLLEILPPVFEKLGTRVVRHASMKKLRAAKREMERVLF